MIPSLKYGDYPKKLFLLMGYFGILRIEKGIEESVSNIKRYEDEKAHYFTYYLTGV